MMRWHPVRILLALICAGTAFGRCPLDFSGNDNAAVGIYMVELSSDSVVAEHNSDMFLTPASVLKSVTTAAALTEKGGDFRWNTSVVAVGRINNGTLNGDLIIRGSGDPTLGSEHFNEVQPDFIQAVKQAAAAKGITRIDGRVRVSADWPDQGPVPSWELEDIPGIDGAGFYALNYKDNIFTLNYPAMTTRPAIPNLEITDVGGSGNLRFFRFPGSRQINLYGKLGRKQRRAVFKCSMPDPPSVLAYEMEQAFGACRKNYGALNDTVGLIDYTSPALRDVTRSMMVRSDNQMAEAALRLLVPGQGRGSALKAEREILSAIGVDMQNVRLADGSGLSRHNAISARRLGELLRLMSRNADFVGSFARVGVDGTVRNFMKNNPDRRNFLLKSGSMTGVVCYVGYRIDPQSLVPTHAIAILINNAPEPSKARAAIGNYLANFDF